MSRTGGTASRGREKFLRRQKLIRDRKAGGRLKLKADFVLFCEPERRRALIGKKPRFC
jgi:hypothetical protein